MAFGPWEIDGLLVPPSKSYKQPTDHLITGKSLTNSSCMTNIKILPHKMADFVCTHWVNCITEYSKVKLERNYVQLFYCQPLTSLRTTHLIR